MWVANGCSQSVRGENGTRYFLFSRVDLSRLARAEVDIWEGRPWGTGNLLSRGRRNSPSEKNVVEAQQERCTTAFDLEGFAISNQLKTPKIM